MMTRWTRRVALAENCRHAWPEHASPQQTLSVDQSIGERAARGATLNGGQVHSVRLPGFVISAEAIFGMPDQRLSIRHDSGSSAKPYVDGALLQSEKSRD
jgi:4-hydroxy-tetrahydrodipicolinate reductase